MKTSSLPIALGALAFGLTLFGLNTEAARASHSYCTNGATLSADQRTCSDGSIPVFVPDTPQLYTPTNVRACTAGRYVAKSSLPVESQIGGTFAVGQSATVINRENVLYNTETVTMVPGADAGILRIKADGTYSWTDGGQVTNGRMSLYEPGVCQAGEGTAHYVVRGSVLGRTVYIVRNGTGITLDDVTTGLYELGGKVLH